MQSGFLKFTFCPTFYFSNFIPLAVFSGWLYTLNFASDFLAKLWARPTVSYPYVFVCNQPSSSEYLFSCKASLYVNIIQKHTSARVVRNFIRKRHSTTGLCTVFVLHMLLIHIYKFPICLQPQKARRWVLTFIQNSTLLHSLKFAEQGVV